MRIKGNTGHRRCSSLIILCVRKAQTLDGFTGDEKAKRGSKRRTSGPRVCI